MDINGYPLKPQDIHLGGTGTNAESAFRVPRSSHPSPMNSAFRVLACSHGSCSCCWLLLALLLLALASILSYC